MLIFKPAIYRPPSLYELPRPVVSLRLQDAWDFARFKAPLFDGEFTVGHSRNGVDLSIEGQFGTQAGALTLTEAEMLAELETLRSALHVAAAEDRYQFFLYHDAATTTYRSLKSCTTVRFEYDLSDKRLFTYAAVIHADDPAIHDTAPV